MAQACKSNDAATLRQLLTAQPTAVNTPDTKGRTYVNNPSEVLQSGLMLFSPPQVALLCGQERAHGDSKASGGRIWGGRYALYRSTI